MVGWSAPTDAAAFGGAAITLVEGSSFCVSEPSGDVRGGTPQGVFFRDTRIISRWKVTLDGEAVETLAVLTPEPWRATFVGRGAPRLGLRESTLLLRRDRYVGQGMREDLTLENLASEPAAIRVAIACDADFADVFEVKESRVRSRRRPRVTTLDGALQLVRSYPSVGGRRGVVVSSDGAIATAEGLSFDVVVPARLDVSDAGGSGARGNHRALLTCRHFNIPSLQTGRARAHHRRTNEAPAPTSDVGASRRAVLPMPMQASQRMQA